MVPIRRYSTTSWLHLYSFLPPVAPAAMHIEAPPVPFGRACRLLLFPDENRTGNNETAYFDIHHSLFGVQYSFLLQRSNLQILKPYTPAMIL
jgi:hypothetical protein